ncbi:MAG: PAS domain S-box protein [Desulfamplus sp.]|nr:PAS domain S-box protein [Desulfamplus sp.]
MRFYHKIRFKITFGIVLIVLILFVALGYSILIDQQRQILDSLYNKGNQIMTVIAKNSIDAIRFYNYLYLEELCITVEQTHGIAFCEVYDTQENSLIQKSTVEATTLKQERKTGANILILELPVWDREKNHLGKVELGLYLDDLKQELKHTTIKLSIVFTIVIIFVVLSLNIFLSLFFITPVIKLSGVAAILAQQKFVTANIKPRQDEIGELIKNFNIMSENLKKSFNKIEKQNQELKESEERFRALHNASFGGISIHDKGLILECNKGMSEITGYDYNELIGMNGLYLISDDTRDTVIQNINAGYEKPYEAKGIRKNGEIYPLRLEGRNIPYKGKNVRVVEFRDITESKRADKEKEYLESQLHQAQKMEAVGRLAGGVAHDFNNMLSVIIGYAGIALNELDPSQSLYTKLEQIRKAGERSADLTRQLLAFARKQTVAPKVLDLNERVAGMTSMIQRLIGEDIDLTWIPGKMVWPVKVDPSQVDQILANLCVNARDAIVDVGKITIETDNIILDHDYCSDHTEFIPGEYVLLSVSDNGCGMDSETIENIFEPFFTTKKSGKGTGLGLATVYGVVKQNSGFINVYSEPGQGTRFEIYLPRYQTRMSDLPEKALGQPAERGHETILLVEDEPEILSMATEMLERLGYTVLAAGTPGEAICLAQEYAGELNLLLTDVVMPEMNGRDLAMKLLSFYPNIMCLFMSGYTADIIAHHGVLQEGMNFIQKPFSMENLATKVRDTLDGVKKAAQD